MSEEEFLRIAIRRGYARTETAKCWIRQNQKEDYSEDDLIELYRFNERDSRDHVKLVCDDEENTFQRWGLLF